MRDIENGKSQCLGNLLKDRYYMNQESSKKKKHFYDWGMYFYEEREIEYLKSEHSWEIQNI